MPERGQEEEVVRAKESARNPGPGRGCPVGKLSACYTVYGVAAGGREREDARRPILSTREVFPRGSKRDRTKGSARESLIYCTYSMPARSEREVELSIGTAEASR